MRTRTNDLSVKLAKANVSLKQVLEDLGYSRQNFYNKMKDKTFSVWEAIYFVQHKVIEDIGELI